MSQGNPRFQLHPLVLGNLDFLVVRETQAVPIVPWPVRQIQEVQVDPDVQAGLADLCHLELDRENI